MNFEDIHGGQLLNFMWLDDPYYVIFKCSLYFRVHRVKTGQVFNLSPSAAVYFMPYPFN